MLLLVQVLIRFFLPVCLFIDIGGGTTDMAVVSQGTMNQVETLRLAGNHFDDEITKYLHDEYGILIGKRTAEEVKNIGGAVPAKKMLLCRLRAGI